MEDRKDLPSTCATHMTLTDKLSKDLNISATGEIESPHWDNPGGDVNNAVTISDVEINDEKKKVDRNPPVKEIASTAFRIRPETDQNKGKDGELFDNTREEPLLTRLHFDSGLTLPVSSASEPSKVAIASSATKKPVKEKDQTSKSPPVISKQKGLAKSRQWGDDVHQKLNFSALKSLATTSQDETKKQKDRIARSKLSASLAMQSALSPSDKDDNVEAKLLQHVRLVFTSALTVVEDILMNGNPTDNEGIEVLTIDPNYVQSESEAGLQFFNDVQYILDQNIKRNFLGHNSDESVICDSYNFLTNTRPGEDDQEEATVSWPKWLLPIIESEEPSTHLLLLLLAKIELSMQDSHNQYIKNLQVRNPTNGIEEQSHESHSLSASVTRTTVDSSFDDISFPSKTVDTASSSFEKIPSVDQECGSQEMSLCLSSHKSISSVGEHFQNTLKTWAKLNSEKKSTHPLITTSRESLRKDQSMDGKELKADLLLGQISLALSPSTSRGSPHERRQNIQQLAKKWREIILLGLSHVQQAMSSIGNDESTSDMIEEKKSADSFDGILDDDASILFKDDSVKVSSGKKKKKKKRRRKRKSTNSSRSSAGDSCQGNSTPGAIGEIKVECKQKCVLNPVVDLSSNINVTEERCSNKGSSPQTTVESKGINDSKGKGEETKSTATYRSPNGDVTTLNTDLKMSLVNGVNGKCVVGGGRLEEDETENSDAWETVEPKGGRANTKSKRTSCDASTTNAQPIGGHGRKNKTKAKGLTRQRTQQRRKSKERVKEVVKDNMREIEHSTLESVDEEIERGLKVTNIQRKERSTRHISDKLKKHGFTANPLPKGMSPDRNARAASCRDVVMGHIASNPPFRINSSLSGGTLSDPALKYVSSTKIKLKAGTLGKDESDVKSNTHKTRSILSADQTATTVQESFCGISVATPSSSNTLEHDTQTVRRETVGRKTHAMLNSKPKDNLRNSERCCDDSSTSGGGIKCVRLSENKAIKSTAPLLQTVIGTRDIDSAKSSVASSLEATREDDVGYHLLKSCEKLSDDMVTFMDRRALALSAKNRERQLLLAALQETLQSIWAGRCQPEIYGSCATKLDLPSSDLDVVIRELIREKEDNTIARKVSQCKSSENTKEGYVADLGKKNTDESRDSSSYRSHHQFYPPLSKNGMRVMRLAAELEKQPWAVQVNPIPTASVPVLKILADPSRLPGVTAGMDWMHQQHMAAAVAAEMNSSRGIQQKDEQNVTPTTDQGEYCCPSASHLAAVSGMSSPPYRTAPAPWRGADVMNGLLSLDITFEGSEHGGLGSTEYTNRVVEDACKETGSTPEKTPAVQVLVVIKELLAQRRLNQPFSGGLSSYAILLLVVALMKERKIIKEEMDLVERQRRAVAFESNASVSEMLPQSQSHQAKPGSVVWPTPQQQSSSSSGLSSDRSSLKEKKQDANSCKVKESVTTEKSNGWDKCKTQLPRKSSWAAIAKKSVTPCNTTQRIPIPSSDRKTDVRKSTPNPTGVDSGNASTVLNAPGTVNVRRKCLPSGSRSDEISKSTNIHGSYLFPQGSNDVLEVLCSGEPTAGKLLMHFLLFYGRHFDAQITCIDLGARRNHELSEKESKLNRQSPYLPRKAGGFYNPVTKVYTVDPVVVYDPWEEAEPYQNVARSCFAWGNIRCIFEQCFNTLSGVVERGNGSRNNGFDQSTTPIRGTNEGEALSVRNVSNTSIDQHHCTDDVSPLLELLLSF